ncbi:phage tail protein [Limnofasciculus baicalensis]|uniref:Phage tail protein n=1 Tax=Limnofasciculus baicalensis BBK-W-15 TaxID=2699891 RepID=A0AAE3KP13_9CYAN|nr:phage tail protein [Limnofasciculus baicalensis]MCP2729238.1 phage tail protein [Limnofasciculus baicalensis BBK-W-15]
MSGNSSDYIKYLPATLQTDELIGEFLLAFEKILTGENFPPRINPGIIESSTSNPPGLEAVIESIHTYFDPDLTPEEFLPWLASWVGLSLRDDWQPSTRREFIKRIVHFYHLRGTKEGLKQVLSLYLRSVDLPDNVTIYEEDYFPPYYFQVELKLSRLESSLYEQQVRIAKAIINQEKPAHTYYGLKIQVPSMRITGNLYGVNIKPINFLYLVGYRVTYMIRATIKRPEGGNNNLRLSIKGGLGQVKIYSYKIGTGDLEVSYTLSEEEIKTVKNWYVAIDNLSVSEAKGSLLITTTYSESKPETQSQLKSETQSQEYKLSLPRGLKIYKPKYDEDKDGNTFLGTVKVET